MKTRIPGRLLALLCLPLLASACGTDVEPAVEAEAVADERELATLSTEEQALTSSAARLVGSYKGRISNQFPVFTTLELEKSGRFQATLDTGIRCIKAPCPTYETLTGRFNATARYLYLVPTFGEAWSSSHGLYRYSFTAGALTLTRLGASWKGWSAVLDRETASASVWPSDVTQLVAVNSGGGFTPPTPAGSDCLYGYAHYTLNLGPNTLFYELCRFVDWNTPFVKVSGQKTLTADELAAVHTAMKTVVVTEEKICGADKPYLTLGIASASQGVKYYIDSFYACQGKGTYVDHIDAPFQVFRSLVGTP